jgi:hypothetical protein
MSKIPETKRQPRFAGYAELVNRYALEVIPNWRRSLVASSGAHRIESIDGTVEETYPSKYWPGETLGDHLEFALKYDGVNLGILASIFAVADPAELRKYVESKPTGKYARRLWCLYELLTGQKLPIADLTRGNYVELLDPGTHYTSAVPRQVRRQRVNDNLLGDARFCPMIRRTETLSKYEAADLPTRCRDAVSRFSPAILRRALSYLYTKETKSSFEIEHLKPSSTRTERFIALLQLAEKEDFCGKSRLIDAQNLIVDPRFQDPDYRSDQNYIGETVAWQRERIHFVSPKPEAIHELMDGLISSHLRMDKGLDSPVVHAAAIAYGFVFLHPFGDGNGRIHRFLIHNILARRGFTPSGLMFPVSAAMLSDPNAYNASLESFSRPLMQLVEYTLDEAGRMTVDNDTTIWRRYIDMTVQAEALFGFIERTIDKELVEELAFLSSYDDTKEGIQEILDLPDRQIDLFIRFCLRNNHRLSARKRAKHFESLSDDEITRMEGVVRTAFGGRGSAGADAV